MLPKDKTIYVAGPMTYRPQFNIPAFIRQAARLRSAGYNVVSPWELDDEKHREAMLASADGKPDADGGLTGNSWGKVMGRDVQIIADQVDAVCVLPGWQKSRGARLEVFVALLCGKPILEDWNYAESTEQVHVVAKSTTDVVFAIARSFL